MNRCILFKACRFVLLKALILCVVTVCLAESAAKKPPLEVHCYRLKTPDGNGDILQASGLHYGKWGDREGLWLVSDRNSQSCGNKIYFIDKQRLQNLQNKGTVAASEAISIVPPKEGWESFYKRHSAIPKDILKGLQQQVENGSKNINPILDLEDITIGKCRENDSKQYFYVIAEQPNSLVLELRLFKANNRLNAELMNCFFYDEGDSAKGVDSNDGLEGIAWSGKPGEFYLVEEGTRPHNSTFSLLYFLEPRLLKCRLKDGRVLEDKEASKKLSQSVRNLKQGNMQTLNAITCLNNDTLLPVDRNGGWILAVDKRTHTARQWLNLYDPDFLNLRERLAEFPGKRVMPYVSIEGIARDARGDIWMVDDPAMPEDFNESCLIRLRNPPEFPDLSTMPSQK